MNMKKEEVKKPVANENSFIKYLIDRYYQTQALRIAIGNEIFQLKEAKVEDEHIDSMQKYHDRFHGIEDDIAKDLIVVNKGHVMHQWLKEVKGIGPIFSAALMSLLDVHKAEHASSFWKYAGLAPGQKRVKGQKIDYNPMMKTTCWKIGESFVKSNGTYRKIYDTSREFYERKFPVEMEMRDEKGNVVKGRDGKPRIIYTKGHKYAMAKRRTVKLFLADFWASWRAKEGLSVSEPFMHRGLANDSKKPITTERVVDFVKPIPKERAALREKPKSPKRVSLLKKPKQGKRSKLVKKPSQSKRANQGKKTVSKKRVVRLKKTKQNKRAKSSKSPTRR